MAAEQAGCFAGKQTSREACTGVRVALKGGLHRDPTLGVRTDNLLPFTPACWSGFSPVSTHPGIGDTFVEAEDSPGDNREGP